MQNSISDIIESFLLKIMGEEDFINICRNELATHFSCAPSQINYVLTTRFTIDRGYVIESRRGGGGYITIFKRPESPQKNMLKELIAENDGGISQTRACHVLDRLCECSVLSKREADIIKAALSDKALRVSHQQRAELRASILEKVLTEILKE